MCVIFPCVIRKATAHVDKKSLNMRHQEQNGFRGIFFGIPYHQKGYLVYVPGTRKIISLYDIVFYESSSIVLAYTSQTYAENMAMRLALSYSLSATSSKVKNGNLITFVQFEEGNLLSETRDDA